MKNLAMAFIRGEEGQDLVEYTLLMAFVALASAAVFVGAGGSLSAVWSSAAAGAETPAPAPGKK
jgi:Flp pilus assembly pilin Flp